MSSSSINVQKVKRGGVILFSVILPPAKKYFSSMTHLM